ncbi:Crp/Fnr family transcriptional regulator [Fulvivirga maritima]|uniref:Crp/Fnr family transcriptional regulator n=1 Tax=Fulvivirga maritima TaxID=2904247 RepID=UPI001F2F6ECC|nr:Crp/Fnr family transcriptional regulator [Fulvivirga maritima]UII25837.1 Crp/Fnr family transcriptional regulator [Fulvivirga maritima]
MNNSSSDLEQLKAFFNSIAPLPDDVFAEVIKYVKKKAYEKGEAILSSGQIETRSNFVLKGVVIQSIFDEGIPITLNITSAGLAFNSLKSYLENVPSEETHEAITPVEVLYILKSDLEMLAKAHHEFCYFLFKLHEVILLDRENRMFLLQHRQPGKRLFLFMQNVERANYILAETPDKYVASYLNMTPQQYSKEKKKYYRQLHND